MKIEFSIRLREESCCLHSFVCLYVCGYISVDVTGWLCQPKDYCVYFCVAAAANSVAFRSKLLQLCGCRCRHGCVPGNCWLPVLPTSWGKSFSGPGQRVESSTGEDLRRAAARPNSFCQDARGLRANQEPIWHESA